ncbi:MAG: MoxR family ATPase [Lentisphaerae bacterium]|jgi:MoxR-like ATPase|nr:MoxR family ATPase [Lentisphaerota bacterium]
MLTEDQEILSRTGFLQEIRREMGTVLVGQTELVDGLLIGLLTGGHILLEGLPGLAKTLAVKTLAGTLGGSFSRVQFTPDVLPTDITGSMIYRPDEQSFAVKIGPVSANIVLADEINRAPAKTQSALLEVMQEHQVSIGGQTIPMPQPYMVVATQNPIEQTGTYPLPEAQKDRFLLRLLLKYPDRAEEEQIIERMARSKPTLEVQQIASLEQILEARKVLDQVFLAPALQQYVLDLVIATRPGEQKQLSGEQDSLAFHAADAIEIGASPRAGIALILAGKAKALLCGRNYVTPEDIQAIAPAVLAHRLILNFEAEAKGISTSQVVRKLLEAVKAP